VRKVKLRAAVDVDRGLGRLGNGSTDEKAGTLDGLFDFSGKHKAQKLILDPLTGLPQ